MRAFWCIQEGSAQMIGVVVALLVSIAVGVMIWYQLNKAVFSAVIVPGKNMAAMNATYLTVNTTANTIWTLFPIVAIVIVAGIILAIVMNFGRGTGQ
jgi:hypothetical protein